MSDIKLYKGDCLQVMQNIPDSTIELILTDYDNGLSMRSIAVKYNTNHKLIGTILRKNHVNIRKPKNIRGVRKYSDKEVKYRNMQSHIRFDIDLNWIMQFEDFDKLKCLNDSISKRGDRYDENTGWYIRYIEKFYYDSQFCDIYERWLLNKKSKYIKPSIDHIIPKSNGGTNDISNLQFLTWFENRCKNNMSQNEWDELKKNINKYFI